MPLGKRVVTGIVVDPNATLNVATDRPRQDQAITEVLDDEPFLPGPVVDLALWVAEYYACGAGDALAAAVPLTQAHKTIRIATLTAQGHERSVVTGPGLRMRVRRMRLDALRGAPRRSLRYPNLTERGISTNVLQRLAQKGLIAFRRERVERDPFQQRCRDAHRSVRRRIVRSPMSKRARSMRSEPPRQTGQFSRVPSSGRHRIGKDRGLSASCGSGAATREV